MSLSAKEKICDALYKLAAEKPVSAIRVSELIAAAGVNRSTFYYHFEDTTAVLEYMMRDFCTSYLETLALPPGENTRNISRENQLQLEKDVCRYIASTGHYVHFFLSERNYWLFSRQFFSCFREYCRGHHIVQLFPDGRTAPLKRDVFYDYFMHITGSQLFAILECWAQREFSETEEDFIHIFGVLHSSTITFLGKE